MHEEIAAALKRGVTVIPVLIEGAALPRGDLLPEDIRELVLHQKHGVTHENFGRDVAGLVEAIKFARKPPKGQAFPTVPWGWIGATAASVLMAGWVGAYQLGVPVWWPFSRPAEPGLTVTQKQLDDAAMKQVRAAEAKAEAEAAAKRRAEDEARARAAAETERQRLAALKAEEDRKRAEADAIRAKQLADADKSRREQEAREKAARDEATRKKAEDDARVRASAEADRLKAAALAKQKADQEAALPDPLLALTPGSGQAARDRLANGQPCPTCPEMVVAPAGSFTMGSTASEIAALTKEFPSYKARCEPKCNFDPCLGVIELQF